MAALIAGVSFVSPSPGAPKSFTSKVRAGNSGNGMSGGVKGLEAADA
jgi:hypothetical protein